MRSGRLGLREKFHELLVDFRGRGLRIAPHKRAISFYNGFCSTASGRKAKAMPDEKPDLKELGYYVALAQVGLEMVVPLLIGVGLDHYFGWSPWATIVGAVLGFAGGMVHLITLVNRHDAGGGSSKPSGGKP